MLRILPFQFVLSSVMNSTDNVLKVSHTDGMFLTQWLGIGDHTYLILQDARGWEVVKYTHTSALTPISGIDVLAIDRAQHNTVRRSWPIGQCLLADRNEGTLREFDIQQAG
ncbi:MAG: hypothetical protein RL260_2741 [Pseudomonadota bacterium]|jgi:hypothetical protein